MKLKYAVVSGCPFYRLSTPSSVPFLFLPSAATIALPHCAFPHLASLLPSDSPEPSLVEVVSRPGIQPLPPLPYYHHLGSGPLPLRIRAIGELLSCLVFIWELI